MLNLRIFQWTLWYTTIFSKHDHVWHRYTNLQTEHDLLMYSIMIAIMFAHLCPFLKKMGHIDLSVNWSVCRRVCRPGDVRWKSFRPFAWKLPNLLQSIYLESRWPLYFFLRSHGLRCRLNCWSLYKWCLLIILLFFSWKVAKPGTVDALRGIFLTKNTIVQCSLLY